MDSGERKELMRENDSMGTRGGPIELFHALGKVLHAKRKLHPSYLFLFKTTHFCSLGDEQGRTESIPEVNGKRSRCR